MLEQQRLASEGTESDHDVAMKFKHRSSEDIVLDKVYVKLSLRT